MYVEYDNKVHMNDLLFASAVLSLYQEDFLNTQQTIDVKRTKTVLLHL